jgi:hypothetical protein
LQLAVARVVIYELDVAQETQQLSTEETELCRELKANTLGLASLARTIARQKSWIRYLRNGDANTKIFHLQACHRKRKSYIPTFAHEGRTFTSEEAKSEAVFDYYNGLLGMRFRRLHRIDLDCLNLPRRRSLGLCTNVLRTGHRGQTDSPPDSIGPLGPSSSRTSAAHSKLCGSKIGGASISSMMLPWSCSGRTRHRPASETTDPSVSSTASASW